MFVYNHTQIRQLLEQIDPLELLCLCYDQPTWQPVYDARQHPDQSVLEPLLAYAARHDLYTELLQWVERHHRRLYQRYAPYRQNPFHCGGYLHQPAELFGREKLVREIRSALKRRQNIALVAPARMGSSSLLYHLFATRQRWLTAETTIAYVDLQGVWDEADFFLDVLRELGASGETHRDFKAAIRGRNTILLLDEVEQLTDVDFNPKLQGLLRSCGQREHFTMCVAAKSPLEKIFPPPPSDQNQKKPSPFHNIFTPMDLPPFTAWQIRQFVTSRLTGSGLTFSEAEIEQLIADSGGRPAEVQRLARDLYEQKMRGG